MTGFRSETLPNGLSVVFFDQSNRYFGDYHRVRIEAHISVSHPDLAEPLIKMRILERMGVAGAEVAAVRQQLCDDFWNHAAGYLGRADYPARLLAAEQQTRRRSFPATAINGY